MSFTEEEIKEAQEMYSKWMRGQYKADMELFKKQAREEGIKEAQVSSSNIISVSSCSKAHILAPNREV